MNLADRDALTETLVELIRHLDAQDKELARRIAELEARPMLDYCGVFEVGRSYKRGSLVTEDGSLWYAMISNPDGRPGRSECWKLCVKKGRDGRDGRAR